MDFSIYVDLILNKFNDAGGYSELDEKDLRRSLELYMASEYDKEIKKITKEMDSDKDDGLELNIDKYQEKFDDLEMKMMIKAKEIAQISDPIAPYKA